MRFQLRRKLFFRAWRQRVAFLGTVAQWVSAFSAAATLCAGLIVLAPAIEVLRLKREAQENAVKLDTANSELNQRKREVAQARSEYDALKANRAAIEKENADLAGALNVLKADKEKQDALLKEQLAQDMELKRETDIARHQIGEAQTKLAQLQADISRLSIERGGYLKATQTSAFSTARSALIAKLREYRKAVGAAQDFLDAPRWQAIAEQFERRMEGKDANEILKLYEEKRALEHKLPGDEAARLIGLRTQGWQKEPSTSAPKRYSLPVLAAEVLARSASLSPKTGRELVLDQFSGSNQFTAADLASFRRTLEDALRTDAALGQSLLVDRKILEGGGDTAQKEIARASQAITALERFLDKFQSGLAGVGP